MSDSEKIFDLTNDFLFKAIFGQECLKRKSSLRASERSVAIQREIIWKKEVIYT